MKGDFSRLTFDRKKRYSGVRMQQGRVQLDADWNEQTDINEHRIGALFTDLIGQSGAPGGVRPENPNFRIDIGASQKDNKQQITVKAGRMYVSGLLCENEINCPFTNQPDYPGATLPTDDGVYFAYLDVWQRLITVLEDPDIREPALEGPDTTARTKNVWQVKFVRVGDVNTEISSVNTEINSESAPDWWEEQGISNGQMSVRVGPMGRLLDNRLYRVEIHTPGARGTATFKWSRDNGSVAANAKQINGTTITLSREGPDSQSWFVPNQWIEFSNDELTLNGKPGIMAKVIKAQGGILEVEKWPKVPTLGRNPIVRRWDSPGDMLVPNETETELEGDIRIRFGEGNYKTGDYWLIPTRSLTGKVEWPQNNGAAVSQPPHGVQHFYVRLALLKCEDQKWTFVADLRPRFPALTEELLSKAGDTMTGVLTINNDLLVDGNVGIGTNVLPEAKLHIEDGGQISLLQSGTVATNSQAGIYWHTVATDYGIYRTPGPWAKNTYQQLKLDWSTGIILEPGTGNDEGYDRSYVEITGGKGLRVTQGKVGIGKAGADEALDVVGNARVSGNVGIGKATVDEALDVSGNAKVSGNLTVNTTLYVDSANNRVGVGASDPQIDLAIGDNNTGLKQQGDGELAIFTNNTERVRIDNNGNVGIGKAVAEEVLDVSGNAKVSGNLTVNTTLYVDSANNRVGVGNSQTATELDVNGTVKATNFVGAIPPGVIVMWSGAADKIPAGWALCDGSGEGENQTPDLRGRFIVGVNDKTWGGQNTNKSGYKIDGVGGAERVALSIPEMPQHDHTITNTGGTGNPVKTTIGLAGRDGQNTETGGTDSDYNTAQLNLLKLWPIPKEGRNQPHENRPPYYVLAFIMKL